MYKLTKSSSIIRLADGASIPNATGNIDYDKYQVWLAEGNLPAPSDPDPVQSAALKIEAIERQSMLPRAAREFMIGVMEDKAIAAGAARTPPLSAAQSIAALRAGNIGYRKVKEQDEQIAVLRGQP